LHFSEVATSKLKNVSLTKCSPFNSSQFVRLGILSFNFGEKYYELKDNN
jgi:predicted transcriptional regulator